MEKLRKIEDEFEARACLGEAARSGERIGAWARARGIDGRSLHAWHVNLSRGRGRGRRQEETESPRRTALVELVPTPASSSSRRYAISVGGVCVEFGDDFEDETLRRVVGVLCSC